MYARMKPKGTGCSLAPTQADGTVIVEKKYVDTLVKLHGFTLIEFIEEPVTEPKAGKPPRGKKGA